MTTLRKAAQAASDEWVSSTSHWRTFCLRMQELRAELAKPDARPAPAEPQGAEAPQEIKSLRDRIIEGELELDGTHPPTLMFLMAEHWKAVATEHYAKAKDYDRLKHELRLSRTAPAPQPAGGEREAPADILTRLRNTPNWMRESYGSWKDCVLKYDRAPFEAAEEIERLRAALSQPTAQQEPVAHMWQHPETGMTGFVEHASPDDLAQWERMNRPRQIVAPLYTQAGERKPPLEWQKAVMEAYGHLWHVNNEPAAPIPMRSPEKAAYEARKCLRELLTKEERGEAINAVGQLIGRGITAREG